MTNSNSRKVIPDNQCIVLLDTNVARELGFGASPPAWVDTFAEMAKSGYSFSLADATVAELLNQYTDGRINTQYDHAKMISTLSKFLNPQVPVLLGKRDIMQMIGAKPLDESWSEAEVLELSKQAWDFLAAAKPDTPFDHAMLQEERDDWKKIFQSLEESWEEMGSPSDLDELAHPQLDLALEKMDHGEGVSPSMSIRNDLQTRLLWRQFVRSKLAMEPYDPTSAKKKNDGIDFDFYRYLALPALVVSSDKGFFGSLATIDSFQKAWFHKPDELAEAWKNGARPLPQWPGA